MKGGGSKAVWNFSKKSLVLVASPVPKLEVDDDDKNDELFVPGLPGGPAGSNCQGGRNSGTDTTRDSDDQLINQLVCDDQYPFDEDHLNNHPLTDDNHIYHR